MMASRRPPSLYAVASVRSPLRDFELSREFRVKDGELTMWKLLKMG